MRAVKRIFPLNRPSVRGLNLFGSYAQRRVDAAAAVGNASVFVRLLSKVLFRNSLAV
jgi:hypothetical protein